MPYSPAILDNGETGSFSPVPSETAPRVSRNPLTRYTRQV